MAINPNAIPACLVAIGLEAEDWGPDVSSYAALAAGWRGSVPCPSEAALEAVEAGAVAKADAKTEILRLEAEVTQRRLREAVLTQEGAAWLSDQETLIAVQRAIVAG